MRDLEGYCETRRQILTLKPAQRAGWLAFSMAAHLLGSHKKALGILESYEHTLTEDAKTGFDYSETLLYKNMLLEEGGELEKAIAHLSTVEPHIVDKQTLNEQRAALLHRVGKYDEAEKVIRGLIKINPDNMQFHHTLIASLLHIDPKTVQATISAMSPEDANIPMLTQVYEELAKDFPKCLAVRRIPLEFMHGDALKSALESYIQRELRRGVPSLFIGLKSLYTSADKRKIVDQVFRATHESLSTKHTFTGSEEKELPSTELWAKYLLAQHLDRIGEYHAALDHVTKAVEHTPTVIELYVLRAKILKHAGDIQGAWAQYDKAREMDLADRYLNTKATLYALRADLIETAEKTIALFTSKVIYLK
jgi:tetratricopeptide (TPR) repeat protein